MKNNEKEREEKLYDYLLKMEDGTAEEKSLAFECIGILGNETTNIKLEDKLTLIENMIDKFNKEKDL